MSLKEVDVLNREADVLQREADLLHKESETHEVKAPDVKALEVKVPEIKDPDAKVPEIKAPDPKASDDAKAPDMKHTPGMVMPSDKKGEAAEKPPDKPDNQEGGMAHNKSDMDMAATMEADIRLKFWVALAVSVVIVLLSP